MDRTRLFAALAILLAVVLAPRCLAVDFRVDNHIYVDKEEEPAIHSTTIFHNNVVYDFLDNPAEVIIFDPAKARFILLDVERKLRTDLSPTVVRQTVDRLKQMGETSEVPKIKFLYDPTFDPTVDEETGELVFESEWLTYRVLGSQPGNPAIVHQYHDFSDWYARLNTFLRPNSRPPFVRLIINEALAKRDEVPRRIELILKQRRGLTVREQKLRSEHQLFKRLVESDRRHIAQAGEYMAAFKQVGFREYEKRAEADQTKAEE